MKSKSIIFAIALAIFVTGCYEDPRYTYLEHSVEATKKFNTCVANGSSCSVQEEAKRDADKALMLVGMNFDPRNPYNLR